MIYLGGLILAALGFLLGRVVRQSEAILSEKRRVYEAFIANCFFPNQAFEDWSPEMAAEQLKTLHEASWPLLLFASANVVVALERYIKVFSEAQEILSPDDPPLHPAFQKAARAHNDLILEMRRDILAFSIYAHQGKSRIPVDTLKQMERASIGATSTK